MHIENSRYYPVKSSDYLNRGAEMASRAAGLTAFGACILALLYMVAF